VTFKDAVPKTGLAAERSAGARAQRVARAPRVHSPAAQIHIRNPCLGSTSDSGLRFPDARFAGVLTTEVREPEHESPSMPADTAAVATTGDARWSPKALIAARKDGFFATLKEPSAFTPSELARIVVAVAVEA
jgi:hypothetical protein